MTSATSALAAFHSTMGAMAAVIPPMAPVIPTPLPREVLAAEAAVVKQHNALQKAIDVIESHKKVINGRDFKLKETVIPDGILVTHRGNPPAEPEGIFKLPAELQDMIWTFLDPADRVILAMTSKSHAAAYNDLKTCTIARPGTTRQTILRLPTPSYITKVHRLKVLVRLKTWMPTKYRLCYSCVLFLNFAESAKHNGSWGGDQQLVSEGLATQKAINRGPRCPLCVQRDQIKHAKGRQVFKAYTSAVSRISLRH